MLTCEQFRGQIDRYLAGQDSLEFVGSMNEHMNNCSACHSLLRLANRDRAWSFVTGRPAKKVPPVPVSAEHLEQAIDSLHKLIDDHVASVVVVSLFRAVMATLCFMRDGDHLLREDEDRCYLKLASVPLRLAGYRVNPL